MSAAPERIRRRSSQRTALVNHVCPSCRATLKPDSKWCPACNFTGGDTIALFSDTPPPLLPILDAVGLWKQADLKKIEAARESTRQRFPQIHWRICTVGLPADTALPVFGFWLLNVCPLSQNETAQERAWTVLLLIDTVSGQATAIPGYAAEPCLNDDSWQEALNTMVHPWSSGNTADAVVEFFKRSRRLLDASWKRNGSHQPDR